MPALSLQNSTFRPRLCPLLLMLLLAIGLVGCGTKMSYRFMDWVVAWSVDDYVRWDSTQQREFDQRLQQTLLWHQRTQLPRYSALLGQLQQDFDEPLSRDLLMQRLDQIMPLWTDIMVQIEPDVVSMLSTLSDQQTQRLLRNLDKQIAKYEKQYSGSSVEQRDKQRVKGVEKFARRFIGPLTREQKTIIAGWGEQVEDSRSEWLQNRKNWRDRFDTALQARQQPQFNEQINQLFLNAQSLWSDEYQRKITANTEHGITLAIALQASLTDKQRRRLNRELDQWQRAFDELASEVAEPVMAGYAP